MASRKNIRSKNIQTGVGCRRKKGVPSTPSSFVVKWEGLSYSYRCPGEAVDGVVHFMDPWRKDDLFRFIPGAATGLCEEGFFFFFFLFSSSFHLRIIRSQLMRFCPRNGQNKNTLVLLDRIWTNNDASYPVICQSTRHLLNSVTNHHNWINSQPNLGPIATTPRIKWWE